MGSSADDLSSHTHIHSHTHILYYPPSRQHLFVYDFLFTNTLVPLSNTPAIKLQYGLLFYFFIIICFVAIVTLRARSILIGCFVKAIKFICFSITPLKRQQQTTPLYGARFEEQK